MSAGQLLLDVIFDTDECDHIADMRAPAVPRVGDIVTIAPKGKRAERFEVLSVRWEIEEDEDVIVFVMLRPEPKRGVARVLVHCDDCGHAHHDVCSVLACPCPGKGGGA